ncbi:hypothetical protein Ddye_012696 [Dipteronia dyeriana]|uniref:HAT C-terminal dimerisation domain-containing protein n=1 Tax=Dipteronia dyeriana TaxID=168575 RepID=A0AAE0CIX3_9ROSI|nr:hypothetical protein Ddye_012696 [Dipteronia dyeriana]
MQPANWWLMYGGCAPLLRAITVRILSQTTSSSACERNWSTFALIHTKQRGWDVRAGCWDAGATGLNATATDWDAHASKFDQNRGRQHGGTSQIDEDSLNMSLSSMSMDTENSYVGDSQTRSGSLVPYYGS